MPSKESIEIRKTIIKDTLREDISLQEERKEWENYALSLPLAEGIELREEIIDGVPCLWVYGEQSRQDQVIVYVHGGGLVTGSPRTHREFASRLVKETQVSVLLVDYRLAPENPYPAGLQDVQAVYRALIKERFQPYQIVFGGDSSGGGLALSALVGLRDAGEDVPAGAFFISGVFDCLLSGESMRTRAELDPFTSQEVLANCIRLYAPYADLRSPLISPLYADLTGMPSLLIQIGDHEILLSDSIRLAGKSKQCGVTSYLRVWDDMWHTWPLYADFPEAQGALQEISEFIRQVIKVG